MLTADCEQANVNKPDRRGEFVSECASARDAITKKTIPEVLFKKNF